ncbi:MAG TPA: carboxyl-terminal protease, partial [Saprospiraceae bacterium]|nr:carboxyl-terminal protease [Saprospiraceae bacterium]
PLSDDGALRLTIARYYTPSGRCIQRDYKHDDHYGQEAERRLHSGELSDATKTRPADTTRFYTGLGRVVYSSGGITPDVFVPLDASFANDYYAAMRRHMAQYAARWMEGRDRASLPATAQDFVKNFSVTDEMLAAWADYTRREGSTLTGAPTASGRLDLQLQLKARIGKLLFQNEGLYRVLNEDDPAVEQALSVMRKPLK